ncbi:MAG: ORC1-type DNA replication protein [Methanomicrobiales archaeon]|nr:ORC1-type DNA replication protein [Methanomicrobiales archaeon]
MAKNVLMWDETLFRDPEVFEIDYLPDEFHHRETQMQELAFQIRPGLRGARPLNTICKGLPGTGKTTSIKKLSQEIEETTKKLVPVQVNCQLDNTKFSIFSQIYRRLTGHLPPTSGASFKQVFDAVARIILRDDVVLLVILDDANYLMYEGELNKTLYTLLRSHESYPGTRIGVILVISDLAVNILDEVDARVASVFRPTEIYFPPYAEGEIRQILHERVLQGLYPGVLSSEMFELVVQQTMQSGDLRVGIDLLKRAVLNAEHDARKIVTQDDITKAYEVSRYLHLTFTIRVLKPEEKLLLKEIATLSTSDAEMNAGEVFKRVRDLMGIRYTKFYEMIRKLDAMRLVNLHYREGRGRTRLISLRYEPARVLEEVSR